MSGESVQEREIVIVGGGLVGCALAVALVQRGFEPTLIERTSTTPETLRGELVMPAGVAVLDRLGLGERLRGVCRETEGVVFHHPAFEDGRCVIDYEIAPVPLDAPDGWRPRGLCGWRRPMYEALREAIRKEGRIEFIEGAEPTAISRASDRRLLVEVSGSQQARLLARLVIATDGRSSRMRKMMGFEPMENVQNTFVQGFVGRGDTKRIHRVQVGFHALGAAFIFPFPDNRFRSTFEFESNHLDEMRTAMPLERHLELLREALPGIWQELGAEAIEPLTDLEIFPGHTTLMAGIVEDGFALAGDAAGCLDPFTGFGMSIGLRDAELLSQCVAEADGDYSARKLRQYERKRQAHIKERREPTDQLAYLFLNKTEGFADDFAEKLAARWSDREWILPIVAVQLTGLDPLVEPSIGMRHHFFGLL